VRDVLAVRIGSDGNEAEEISEALVVRGVLEFSADGCLLGFWAIQEFK